MLTLVCAYAVLAGGRGICRLLRDRLHDTSAWTTPAWCIAYLATIDSDMVWGQTAGVPRNPHAEHLEPADEMPDIAHEPDGDDADFGPSEQNFNGGISADARAVLQSIGESVLNLAEQSMASKAASHNGWRPFNALGFSGAQVAWQRISRESLTKWSRATAAKPMSLFPDQGLIMKVLLDRIGELWVDGGFGTRDQFLETYSP
ncbi:unnamed protein product, partial [Durusdinium trenchii]